MRASMSEITGSWPRDKNMPCGAAARRRLPREAAGVQCRRLRCPLSLPPQLPLGHACVRPASGRRSAHQPSTHQPCLCCFHGGVPAPCWHTHAHAPCWCARHRWSLCRFPNRPLRCAPAWVLRAGRAQGSKGLAWAVAPARLRRLAWHGPQLRRHCGSARQVRGAACSSATAALPGAVGRRPSRARARAHPPGR